MKKKLVIVDDEPSISMIIELNLSNDYSIESFLEKSQFIEYANQNAIDALVLDLNLNGESGKTLIPLIRNGEFEKVNPLIPIVVLSGEDSTEEKINCLEDGADDYLVKPFNPLELKARMKRIFSRMHG
ncbi:response regulator transcription factor [Luteibaculum oceani]|uniref:Response regulator transcription factor n=1 Tax=Luteibaculum oceani TaxID=1294296 RepID=A0A5C6UVX6_9FLAO|nr:response regulator transcription factor [Luteibaculum oceani]TXC77119.1 response regulator transcription factor [Luteibaculum oceani]